jgi:hypothetical protein
VVGDLTRLTPKEGGAWHSVFLEALDHVPNVAAACQVAGVSRDTAYRHRRQDEYFALGWQEALEASVDAMEQVAIERATAGEMRRKRTTKTFPDGRVEVTETEWLHVSDTLLIFMLKAHRPEKFRDGVTVRSLELTAPQLNPVRERTPERLAELLQIAQDLGWTARTADGESQEAVSA